MLVSIVGSPCSGKTTSAARAFAYLKEQGIYVEFISEQARWFIARKRLALGLKPEENLELTSQDQVLIMKQQLEIEETLKRSSGSGVIVLSDSSALNALLYMDDETRKLPEVQEMTQRAVKLCDMLCHAKPLPSFMAGDPNRVHDREFSLDFEKRLPALVEELGLKVSVVLDTIFEREFLATWILQSRCEAC